MIMVINYHDINNPLCKMLNIRYPIIQAGMAGSTTPELVEQYLTQEGLELLGC